MAINTRQSPEDRMRLHEGLIARSRSDEEYMIENGILLKEDGKLKCNETAFHALTVLAKAWGKKVPNIASSEVEMVRADDTNKRTGEP